MEMATNIDDLPGPLPEDLLNDIDDIKDKLQDNNRLDYIEPNNSNVRADMKKRVHFNDDVDNTTSKKEHPSLLGFLKSQVNEENAVLLIIIFAASLPQLTVYIKNAPLIGGYATSDFATGLLKAALLLVLFVLVKKYVLPKIRL